jgi:hypothetical protein
MECAKWLHQMSMMEVDADVVTAAGEHKLNVSDNGLGVEGVEALMVGVANNRWIHSLDLSSNLSKGVAQAACGTDHSKWTH